jgi:hypothetical protein
LDPINKTMAADASPDEAVGVSDAAQAETNAFIARPPTLLN